MFNRCKPPTSPRNDKQQAEVSERGVVSDMCDHSFVESHVPTKQADDLRSLFFASFDSTGQAHSASNKKHYRRLKVHHRHSPTYLGIVDLIAECGSSSPVSVRAVSSPLLPRQIMEWARVMQCSSPYSRVRSGRKACLSVGKLIR